MKHNTPTWKRFVRILSDLPYRDPMLLSTAFFCFLWKPSFVLLLLCSQKTAYSSYLLLCNTPTTANYKSPTTPLHSTPNTTNVKTRKVPQLVYDTERKRTAAHSLRSYNTIFILISVFILFLSPSVPTRSIIPALAFFNFLPLHEFVFFFLFVDVARRFVLVCAKHCLMKGIRTISDIIVISSLSPFSSFSYPHQYPLGRSFPLSRSLSLSAHSAPVDAFFHQRLHSYTTAAARLPFFFFVASFPLPQLS